MKPQKISARLAKYTEINAEDSGEDGSMKSDSSNGEEDSESSVSSSEHSDEGQPPSKKPRANDASIEEAVDGTKWTILCAGSSAGRQPIHNIFKEKSGPTAYTKRHIMAGRTSSAFKLLINDEMIEKIKTYTEEEAFRVLKKQWTVSTVELWAVIGIAFARGAFDMKNISIKLLWSQNWGPRFIKSVMSRNRYMEINRFLRFDSKNRLILCPKFGVILSLTLRFVSTPVQK